MNKDFEPVVAKRGSYVVAVEAGKSYAWCACGKSNNQPFCDGSHAGTDIAPIMYQATESKNIAFCGCKKTKASPLCDGTHKNL
jgi:CDGSH-type Zn-finger protein